jgi:hypothetical protein
MVESFGESELAGIVHRSTGPIGTTAVGFDLDLVFDFDLGS